MSGEIEDYEIGYGKPPKDTRFKKGESGNPNGRPRGSLNLATVLERALREKVIINENGQRKVVTKLEAAVKQVVNKSAAGDLGASKFLLLLIRYGEEDTADATTPPSTIGENDRKVMQGLLKRFGASQETEEAK